MREALRRGRAAVVAVLAAAALLLAGCSPGPAGKPAAGGGQSAGAHPSPRQTPVWNPHPSSIAALGDSITRGFDACSLLSDCPQASWVTGNRSDVASLAQRLGARSWNLASSGARMAALRDQAVRAAALRPQLVTVLMGSNDVCRTVVGDMTSVADYRTGFTAAMEALHRDAPGTEIYVASLPDLRRLWSVGHSDALGVRIWNLGVCPSMLAQSQSLGVADQARRDQVRARIVAYDDVLRQVCGRYPRCRYDGGAVFGDPFQAGELSSWDWFHPSVQGQARLARIAYAQITRR